MTQALEKVNIDFTALQSFIPAEQLQEMNDKFAAGISGGTFLPELKYRGNKWRLKIDGEEKMLPTMVADVPDTLLVHLVEARPAVSKTFYASGYSPGSDAKPDCSSIDGVVPDSHISDPQNTLCATCPHNAWGSRVGESGKGKACSDYKQLVVALKGHPEKAFALRVPPASLKGYKAYISQLAFNKVPAVAAVTQVTLDPESESPKLLFSVVGIVQSREEFDALTALADTDDVQQVVQIQPRVSSPHVSKGSTTAEQPVVVPSGVGLTEGKDMNDFISKVGAAAASSESGITPAVDLKELLAGNEKTKKAKGKKTAEKVIEESTAESEPVSEAVSTLDDLLSRI